MKCIKCEKEFYDSTENKSCGNCLRDELGKMKIVASSGGSVTDTYKTCVNIQFFCDDYSDIYINMEYPKFDVAVLYTVDDFVDWYESFEKSGELYEIKDYSFTVIKYQTS